MSELKEIIKIANIHAARIQMALDDLQQNIPFQETTINSLNKEALLLTDLLVNRFGKLQDLLGTKLIDAFLVSIGEFIDHRTMIDKINLLERLEIVEDAEIWKEMRKARNHAAHEYPDNDKLTAKHLNDIVKLAPELLKILKKIKDTLK